jgi:uncharacterized membrane protein YhaH (DUF805 family)
MFRKNYLVLILFLFLHLLILSKLQFTAWPEMVSFPYLINHGFITYKDMVHAYPPLLINILAILYKIFGYNVWVLKTLVWTGIIFSDFIVFLILKKLVKKENLALIGAVMYIILQPILEGNMIWPDLFIVPFLLFGFLLLLNKKYFWAGLTIGLAVLVKQTGVLFLGISGLYLIYERNRRNITKFIFGVLVVIIPFLLILILQNSFVDFINWTIIYPSQFWTKFPGYVQLIPTLRENLILLILFIPVSYLLIKKLRQKGENKEFYLLLGFFVCGAIGIYPRFSFFHFQSGLAFWVILILYLAKNLEKKYIYGLLLIPVFVSLVNLKSFKDTDVRFWNENDIKLANIIHNDSPVGQSIYLFGLDSNLYALSERLPNKPWLDNFGWYLEIPGVQEKVINSFIQNPPSRVFWATPGNGNWYDIGTYQPQMITDYILKNYTRTREIQKGIWEWARK